MDRVKPVRSQENRRCACRSVERIAPAQSEKSLADPAIVLPGWAKPLPKDVAQWKPYRIAVTLLRHLPRKAQ